MVKSKFSFKKIAAIFTTFILMIASIFNLTGCGLLYKEVTPEYAFVKVQSAREKLLTSFDNYKYIELEISYYNEETFELEKTQEIQIHNVIETENDVIKTVDRLFFMETYYVESEMYTYELLRRDLNNSVYYYSVKYGEELVKTPKELLDTTVLDDLFIELSANFYNEEMLPSAEETIILAYKKTISSDVNKLASYGITFEGSYNGAPAINEISFNYSTEKIHFVKNYTEDMHLLREMEYTYPNGIVTKVDEIDMSLFETEKVLERESKLIESGEVVLDGNYIERKEVNAEGSVYAVRSEGNETLVTINSGHYDAGAGSLYNIAVWAHHGSKIVINDGYFSSGNDVNGEMNHVVYAAGGATIEINGGWFESKGDPTMLINAQNGNATIVIKGGSFVNFDPSNCECGSETNFVAEGFTVVSETFMDDIIYTVVPVEAE